MLAVRRFFLYCADSDTVTISLLLTPNAIPSHTTSCDHPILHFTKLHFTTQHFTTLHYTKLHFTKLHFTNPVTPVAVRVEVSARGRKMLSISIGKYYCCHYYHYCDFCFQYNFILVTHIFIIYLCITSIINQIIFFLHHPRAYFQIFIFILISSFSFLLIQIRIIERLKIKNPKALKTVKKTGISNNGFSPSKGKIQN